MVRAVLFFAVVTLGLAACGMPPRESIQNSQNQSSGCANAGTLIRMNQTLIGGNLAPKINFGGTDYRIGSQSNANTIQTMNNSFPNPTSNSQANYPIQFGGTFGYELMWTGPVGPFQTQQNVPVIHLNCIQ